MQISKPFLMRFAVVLLHLCIGLTFYYAIAPFSPIPSDETLYEIEVHRFSACLDRQAFCLPPAYGVATKPLFIALVTAVYRFIPDVVNHSAIDAIAFVSFLALGGLGALIHLLVRRTASKLFHLLVFLVFYGSITVVGNQLWLGYDTVMSLFILLALLFLHSFITSEEDVEKLYSFKPLFFGVCFLLFALLALFTHIVAALYIGAGLIASVLLLFFVPKERTDWKRMQQLRVRRLLAITFLLALLLFFFDWFSAVFLGVSYLVTYLNNILLNVSDQIYTYGATSRSGYYSAYFTGGKDLLLFHLAIPFYYLVTEPLSFLLTVSLLLWCFLWKFRENQKKRWQESAVSLRGYLYAVGLLSCILLSLSPNEKLLRVFYPLHPLLLLLLLSVVAKLFDALKEEVVGGVRRKVLYAFLAIFLLNATLSAHQSFYLYKGVYGVQKEIAPLLAERKHLRFRYNPEEAIFNRPFQSSFAAFYAVRPVMAIGNDSFKWRISPLKDAVSLQHGKKESVKKGEFFLSGVKTEGETSLKLLKEIPFLRGNGSAVWYFESANSSQYAIKQFLSHPFRSVGRILDPTAPYRDKDAAILYLYEATGGS